MKNTNPIFSLKNFRSFGEEGADFELAPITVLTGCNSAGKSSLVKAQLLLEQALKDEKVNLHVSDKELKLGNFSKIINNRAKNGIVTFSYVTHSKLLYEDVRVTLEFIDNNDVVGDGKLLSRSVEKLDGTQIVHKNGTVNYLAILDNFRRYAVFNIFDGSIVDVKEAEIREDDAAAVNNYMDRYNKSLEYCKRYGLDDDMLFAYRSTKHLDKAHKNTEINDMESWQADLEGMFDEVSSWIETNTFFYSLPIFKAVEGKDKKYVREYLLESIASGNQEKSEGKYNQQRVDSITNRADSWGIVAKSAVTWAHHIADDFEMSKYDSFLEYFISLEQDAMLRGGLFNSQGISFSLHPEFQPIHFDWMTEDQWDKECKEYHEKVKKYEKDWSFMAVVEALSSICFHYDDTFFLSEFPQNPIVSGLKLKRCLYSFFKGMISEVYSPLFLNSITYVNSSSVDIKRLYSSDDNDKIGICIKKYLEGNKQTFDMPWNREMKIDYKPGEFMNKWIKNFGLGKSIEISGTDEGLGVLVYLEKEHEKVLLADEGYGVTQLIALLLQIENKILNATRWSFAIAHGLWGKSPIQYVPSVIFIEEPENHLHPKYQSLLADMFVEAYQKYNIHFIIETHSEYLIRKLQVLVADKENKLTPNDVSLNYVDKDENGISTNRKIEILEDGRLSEPFGPGFFDEADSLAMDLMKYKVRR
ncbi:MAG: DUF3696 domain-containing protein [Bacteroidales bacterium]|nr:DUF3696 domain-containing protein [Bacteroidales bacterium]